MILLFIQEVAKETANSSYSIYRPEFISGAIALILWYFKNQSDRRYIEYKALKSQVYKNKENILQNVLKDESDSKEFENYKKLIDQKNKHFEQTLTKIDGSINGLTTATGKLEIAVAKLESKIK